MTSRDRGSPHPGTRESALLIAVPEAEPVVGRWRELHDPSTMVGIPAHITLLYPFLPPDRLGEGELEELRALFAGTPPIRFRLQRFGRFPDVLYLAPEPVEPFERLTAAVATLFPEAPPYGGAHSEVVPHLTVAHSEDPAALDAAEEAVAAHLPIEASAGEVWLMVERGDDRWRLREELPLGGRT